MDKHKNAKRKDDDRSQEPGRPSQPPAETPEPERRFPDANRPDTLRPGPGERNRKGRAREDDDEEGRLAPPVK